MYSLLKPIVDTSFRSIYFNIASTLKIKIYKKIDYKQAINKHYTVYYL